MQSDKDRNFFGGMVAFFLYLHALKYIIMIENTHLLIIISILFVLLITASVVIIYMYGKKVKLQSQLESQDVLLARNKEDMNNMKDSFKAIASDISARNAEEFRRQSVGDIESVLKPIKEKFGQFDQSVRQSQTEITKQNASLEASIRHIMETSTQVGEEAKNLANALSGRSKVQGDFGEMLLRDILNNAGLQEGIHYLSQSVMTDENGYEVKSESGKTMIPDVLILYPDDTLVVVDSKVSLKDFNNYVASVTVEDREYYAKAHVASVQRHVDELKKKDYAGHVPDGKRRVDYNIMFIPVESAFQLMLTEAPMLWQTAKDANVLIVSQMTLIIVLNMIQMSWKQAAQEENIAKVYKTASELMSQLQGWMLSYTALGDNISKVAKSYEESKRKLVDSNQSVIKKIEKLEALELSPKRSMAKVKVNTLEPSNSKKTIIPQALAEG